MVRVAINGFGRIGRTILRLAVGERPGFEIVAINDIAPLETCAYLFQFDSVFGPYRGSVTTAPGTLVVDGQNIPFSQEPDIRALDLDGVDVVLECTGHNDDPGYVRRGLEAGARSVLVSGPSAVADITLVMGANDGALRDQAVVSNASCTTNVLAPLARVLDEAFGLVSGQMTTVHCYTGSQPTVDKPRGADMARSRAAALSMVPTTTSAQRLLGDVLPHLAGRIEARAIRVPTASVSAIDLVVQTRLPATVETANAAMQAASKANGDAREGGLIGWTQLPLVSSDLRARPESIILSGLETSVSVGGLLRVFGWYDNEWGFSNRMLDMAARMAARAAAPGAGR